jgi:transposase InsO family protein
MSRTVSPSAGRRYGLALVCRVWEIARSSVYEVRTRQVTPAPPPRKRGPKTELSDQELTERIRQTIAASPWLGEGYRKVWAQLCAKDIRVCKRRVLRLMREANLLSPSRTFKLAVVKDHDGRITTDLPDEMWGTDQTGALTAEGHACIFIAVDHCTAECLGIHATRRGNRFEALEPIRQGVRRVFGSYDAKVAVGLKLRHDHGSQFISDAYQTELDFLGIESSPAFVREPEGNGVSERFIRTLKEQLLWLRYFATVEELRLALLEFKEKYNRHWLLEKHGYRTPAQVRAGFEAVVAA